MISYHISYYIISIISYPNRKWSGSIRNGVNGLLHGLRWDGMESSKRYITLKLVYSCQFTNRSLGQSIWCFKIRSPWIMMTSSNGTIFRATGPLWGEFTGPGDFLAQRPVTRSFDVFFDLRLNKRLSKQLWGWWFETLSRSLWRHCNDNTKCYEFSFRFNK